VSRRRRRAIALVVALAAAAPPAWANCTLGVQGLVFGSYDTLSSVNLDTAGTLTVTCDTVTSFTVALSPGHGTLLARQMQSSTSALYYNLYTDALRSIVWGDGSGATSLVSGTATSALYTVYGRIPAGQKVTAGSYGDVITVTLSF
jgi:spore coat protein U-like protein